MAVWIRGDKYVNVTGTIYIVVEILEKTKPQIFHFKNLHRTEDIKLKREFAKIF